MSVEDENKFVLKAVDGSEYNGQFVNDKIKLEINNNEMEVEVSRISHIIREEN